MPKFKPDKQTDVLVIGAGLAGIRAALAAKETNPKACIHLVSASSLPHGSSFSNIHTQLGIQVCHNREEKELFVQEAVSIAPPGEINQRLVQLLAEESENAFQNLKQLGAKFEKDSHGQFKRVNGCFSPVQERAYILCDLDKLYFKLRAKLESKGIQLLAGWQAQNILTQGEPESLQSTGAVLKCLVQTDLKQIHVYSKAIVLAIGGYASSNKIHIAGSGRFPLILHDWCRTKKIEYVNREYTQFVWCKHKDFSDWRISCLNYEEFCFRDLEGKIRKIPKRLKPLFEMRSIHVPVSYGFEDRAVDSLLMENLNDQGWVEVFHPDTGWEKVVLAAQVSNGGIRIDENGYAGIKGLYACGECAGGMHGANRIGGAMVLAGQVFGKRAGIAAADFAKG